MISSDVNVLFIYGDPRDRRNFNLIRFCKRNQRRSYLLLEEVKKSFIKTFSDYYKIIGSIIDDVIITYRAQRLKSPGKRQPSTEALIAEIDKNISKKFSSLVRKTTLSMSSLKRFYSKLLKDYSIPRLYHEDKLIGEFREFYSGEAENEATDVMNRFILEFRSLDVHQKQNCNDYDDNYVALDSYFRKDHEDRRIAAELMCYTLRKHLQFLCGDKAFRTALRKIKATYGLNLEVAEI